MTAAGIDALDGVIAFSVVVPQPIIARRNSALMMSSTRSTPCCHYILSNANGVQTITTTFATTSSRWLNATGVQDPRQFQISTQFDF